MTFKQKIRLFTKTASLIDLRTTADKQRIAAIKARAVGYMVKNKNYGRAVYV